MWTANEETRLIYIGVIPREIRPTVRNRSSPILMKTISTCRAYDFRYETKFLAFKIKLWLKYTDAPESIKNRLSLIRPFGGWTLHWSFYQSISSLVHNRSLKFLPDLHFHMGNTIMKSVYLYFLIEYSLEWTLQFYSTYIWSQKCG
jgi:hypothetical protein